MFFLETTLARKWPKTIMKRIFGRDKGANSHIGSVVYNRLDERIQVMGLEIDKVGIKEKKPRIAGGFNSLGNGVTFAVVFGKVNNPYLFLEWF